MSQAKEQQDLHVETPDHTHSQEHTKKPEHGNHGHNKKIEYPVINPGSVKKRSRRKYHLPVIGHFADKSVEFKNILEAEEATGISYQMIFEACVGKIFMTKNVIWEFKKGNHYIKYKAFYINAQENFKTQHGGDKKE